jgi:hypothetical protein
MVLQHFGLTQYPLGKGNTELWDDGLRIPDQRGRSFRFIVNADSAGT